MGWAYAVSFALDGPDPQAVATLQRDWERMVTFYDTPKEHWKHLRTNNPVNEPLCFVTQEDAGRKTLQTRPGSNRSDLAHVDGGRITFSKTQCARNTAPHLRRATIPEWETPQEQRDIHQEKVEAVRLISTSHLFT